MIGLVLFLTACGSTDDTGEQSGFCYRPADWRDPVVLVDGVASVPITESCDATLSITEATLVGVGFEADLPDVGDSVSGADWVVDVSWVSTIETPGTYSATLKISADGLDDQPPKELTYVIEAE